MRKGANKELLQQDITILQINLRSQSNPDSYNWDGFKPKFPKVHNLVKMKKNKGNYKQRDKRERKEKQHSLLTSKTKTVYGSMFKEDALVLPFIWAGSTERERENPAQGV